MFQPLNSIRSTHREAASSIRGCGTPSPMDRTRVNELMASSSSGFDLFCLDRASWALTLIS